jgi:hypothetical protein
MINKLKDLDFDISQSDEMLIWWEENSRWISADFCYRQALKDIKELKVLIEKLICIVEDKDGKP